MWWIPVGNIPSIEEASQRLESLRQNGPNPEAFTLLSAHLNHILQKLAGKIFLHTVLALHRRRGWVAINSS